MKSHLVRNKAGIQLDIGCGANKQPNFVGMDIRALPGVDIVHDINVHPWPLDDECVIRAMASHMLEHIPPVAIAEEGTRFPFVEFMNELWRVSKPGAEFMASVPYGSSPGFLQDPTHVNPINEATFAYFDPLHRTQLWLVYEPMPWYYRYVSFDPIWNLEAVLMRHSEDETLWKQEREQWGPMRLG